MKGSRETLDREQLQDAIRILSEEKGVDPLRLAEMLREAFLHVLKKRYRRNDLQVDFRFNPETGIIELWRIRTVVPDNQVKDPFTEVALSEAKAQEPDLEVGEELVEQMPFDFNNREIEEILSLLTRRIATLRYDDIKRKYLKKKGELVTLQVHQVTDRGDIILRDDEGVEIFLPREEQIFAIVRERRISRITGRPELIERRIADRFREGDYVRAIIKEVRDQRTEFDRGEEWGKRFVGKVRVIYDAPLIIASRKDYRFLIKLMEQEIAEIQEGLVRIRNVARIPGVRSKVLVESVDERIDPIGACVGPRGSRINRIVRELRGERIDIVVYTDDIALLVERALAPARISAVEVEETGREDKPIKVYAYVKGTIEDYERAIGDKGINVELASRLLGWEIEVIREKPETAADIPLMSIAGQTSSPELVVSLIRKGLRTVGDVLEMDIQELAHIANIPAQQAQQLKDQLEEIWQKEARAESGNNA